MSKEAKILSAVLAVVVGGMIALFMLSNSSSKPTPVADKTKVIRNTTHKTGTGPVQVVEFGDFQCPACAVVEVKLEQLLKDETGKITFYFRNFPLTQLHQNATGSSNAAEAAADQGKYWEMHDKLYATQKDWETVLDPTDLYVSYAKDLGLDTAKFRTALTNKQFQAVIDQDSADATALGVNATPTFYFDGVKYDGSTSYSALRDKVESLVTK